MREAIEKILFQQLKETPNNKALLLPDFQVRFESTTGERLDQHTADFNAVAEHLEKEKFVRFDSHPKLMMRLVKGTHFDKWESIMRPQPSSGSIQIGSINGQQVQVGDQNAININVTPRELVDALVALVNKPEESKPFLEKLKAWAETGLSTLELVKKIITFS